MPKSGWLIIDRIWGGLAPATLLLEAALMGTISACRNGLVWPSRRKTISRLRDVPRAAKPQARNTSLNSFNELCRFRCERFICGLSVAAFGMLPLHGQPRPYRARSQALDYLKSEARP